ncbi:MAG TPA: hypothetical protein VFJ92_10910 [Gemmatimonadales bacterium]|nr:hypothetical protein [Gemmatimonadales bacterium]
MRRSLAVLILLALPATAAAQSSQLSARGLGQPGRWLSPRSTATGGAFGMFDPGSSLNPAALDQTRTLTASFMGLQDYRNVENPSGTASLRDNRFPLVSVAGPTRRGSLVLGLSYSNYADRDFSFATVDTLDPRGTPVTVFDTLSSRGGISDFRVGGSYRLSRSVVGGSFHILTGSNRLESKRSFEEGTYLPLTEKAEVSYGGVGVSLGLVRDMGSRLSVAVVARTDGHLDVDKDSTRVGEIDLPATLGLAARVQFSSRLTLAGSGVYRTWSASNSDLLATGAVGSDNTLDLSFGGEFLSDIRRPTRRPIRFGGHYATLPFLLEVGQQPTEIGVSAGTGMSFAQDRGGIDMALEYLWREAGEFKERVFQLSFGVSVRP